MDGGDSTAIGGYGCSRPWCIISIDPETGNIDVIFNVIIIAHYINCICIRLKNGNRIRKCDRGIRYAHNIDRYNRSGNIACFVFHTVFKGIISIVIFFRIDLDFWWCRSDFCAFFKRVCGFSRQGYVSVFRHIANGVFQRIAICIESNQFKIKRYIFKQV